LSWPSTNRPWPASRGVLCATVAGHGMQRTAAHGRQSQPCGHCKAAHCSVHQEHEFMLGPSKAAVPVKRARGDARSTDFERPETAAAGGTRPAGGRRERGQRTIRSSPVARACCTPSIMMIARHGMHACIWAHMGTPPCSETTCSV
jgi:hypothetical protein